MYEDNVYHKVWLRYETIVKITVNYEIELQILKNIQKSNIKLVFSGLFQTDYLFRV